MPGGARRLRESSLGRTNTPSPRYSTLRDYLRVIREQRWIILAITLVAGGIAFAVSIRQDDVYETSAALSFQDKSQQLSLLGGSVSPRTPAEETPQARAETIESPAVIKRVQRALDTEVPVGGSPQRSAPRWTPSRSWST